MAVPPLTGERWERRLPNVALVRNALHETGTPHGYCGTTFALLEQPKSLDGLQVAIERHRVHGTQRTIDAAYQRVAEVSF